MERWVVNASPLICLAKAGYADLLLKLAEETIVPHAVLEEIWAGPVDDPARLVLTTEIFPVTEVSPLPEILAWDLGKGETAVLSYVLTHPGWTAIVDDRAARKCALSYSIPVKGTLAVVILARKRGLVNSAADVLHALQEVSIRLDDDVIRKALKRSVGEDW